MSRRLFWLLPAALVLFAANGIDPSADVFLVKPYLQLGDSPKLATPESLVLMWHTRDEPASFAVQVRQAGSPPWSDDAPASSRRIAVRGIDPHLIWTAPLNGLKPGGEFDYRVLKSGKPVFESRTRARVPANQAHRFVVFGDCGAGTPGQKALAFQVHQARSDYVFITGDIVYGRGRISEYRPRHFGVYNVDTPSPEAGAPLLRSTLFIAVPGNHDIASTDLTTNPDGLAYFYYWSQPLNGPVGRAGDPSAPPAKGEEADRQAFLSAAGANFPRMASFSFDYGNAHWVAIDSNRTVDWRDPALRDWLINDLKNAQKAAWRFVGFHHIGLQSSKAHFNEQHMRHLSPIFEQFNVDLVFTGHVHNYQRTYPMRFKPTGDTQRSGRVDGEVTLDQRYDGARRTRPRGVIYLVTGAGGARLYDPDQQDDRATWQPFTVRFISKVHSFTQVDVRGRRLTVRQIDADGREVDRFIVAK